MTDKYLHRTSSLPSLGDALPGLDDALPSIEDALSRRVNADPENVERGLAQLVLTIVELLRQLMERQALRRIDDGTLSDEQIERLGQTFMKLADRMEELRTEFGLDEEDLNLRLGPLGNLL
jgi:regulator of sirC expression with transglutaminase-like and TPR domain